MITNINLLSATAINNSILSPPIAEDLTMAHCVRVEIE